ncbi:hypothetical protein IBL26_16335 [Roseomonas aerophila]|uniref:Uncharacterized protein n=1 Tax=Teichococcus aerophilus TaxID=1224513 RepID=A0ABR7RP93_9PROT|nr:hypothetical protein [Pseudoroseomonas aerophila]MBC9208416.1 hypothetical protein [Pseudoroseomonas aerophila]
MNETLPRTDFDGLKNDSTILLAGTEDEQRRLSLIAWEAMEVWGPPGREAWTRISSKWLAENRWRVGLGGYVIPHNALSIEQAIRARGHRSILATQVDGRLLRPSAVWRLPVDLADMDHVRQNHFGAAVLFFTEERDFLIHCDGDESTAYAGPPDFVNAAMQSWLGPDPEKPDLLPAPSIQAATENMLETMRETLSGSEGGQFQAAEFERHHRPFLA